MKIYVASSWRNLMQIGVVTALRHLDYTVYDFKHPEPGNEGFCWTEIDPNWKFWQPAQYRSGLEHPVAEEGFCRDMTALQHCDVCVLVLPCGRSAHIEAGYAIGAGKPTAILMTQREEPELMYKMASAICLDLGELFDWCARQKERLSREQHHCQ